MDQTVTQSRTRSRRRFGTSEHRRRGRRQIRHSGTAVDGESRERWSWRRQTRWRWRWRWRWREQRLEVALNWAKKELTGDGGELKKGPANGGEVVLTRGWDRQPHHGEAIGVFGNDNGGYRPKFGPKSNELWQWRQSATNQCWKGYWLLESATVVTEVVMATTIESSVG